MLLLKLVLVFHKNREGWHQTLGYAPGQIILFNAGSILIALIFWKFKAPLEAFSILSKHHWGKAQYWTTILKYHSEHHYSKNHNFTSEKQSIHSIYSYNLPSLFKRQISYFYMCLHLHSRFHSYVMSEILPVFSYMLLNILRIFTTRIASVAVLNTARASFT